MKPRESVTDGLSQFAGVPLRHPRKTTIVLRAVTLNEHEKELLNRESAFSQTALDTEDKREGEATAAGARGMTVNDMANVPRISTAIAVLNDEPVELCLIASHPNENCLRKQNLPESLSGSLLG